MNYENIFSVIDQIYNRYDEIQSLWIETMGKNSINIKKTNVVYFTEGNNIEYIDTYRKFIESNSLEFTDELNKIYVSSRIKTPNSINTKLDKYATKDDKEGNIGKFPIKDCLNDLFGARLIVNDEYTYEDIISAIKVKYDSSRVYLKNDNGYIGIHFYFKRNNQMLPWELQIWRKSDENNNKKSHRMYKQGYTSWENDVKIHRDEVADTLLKVKHILEDFDFS